MATATEVSAARFENITANAPLNNNYPLFAETEVEVLYGSQGLKAVRNVDFTVQLSEPNYNSFTITPLPLLLTKINALIDEPPTDAAETNFVLVRRKLNYLSSVTPENVHDTTFLARELDRMSQKMIQLQEQVDRALQVSPTIIGVSAVTYSIGAPVEGKAPVWRGNILVPEIDAADISGAQGYASAAAQSLADAEELLDDMEEIRDDVEAAALLLPLNNYTAVTDPGVGDDSADGYSSGSQWINTLTGDRFSCSDASLGAAVWTEISADLSALGTMAYEAAADYLAVANFDPQDIREIPQNSKSADYTLVLSDGGKHIFHPATDGSTRTWTIPANASVAYDVGTAITFVNEDGAGAINIAITTDTLVLAGDGSTGTRALAAGGIATALKIKSGEWIISGTGLS